MFLRIEVRDRFNDLLGDLPDDPIAINEYGAYPLKLIICSNQLLEMFSLQVGNKFLERDGDTFQLESNHGVNSGRRGMIIVQVFYRNSLVTEGKIAVTGGGLSEEQYRYLVQDLKRLSLLDLHNDSDVRGSETRLEPGFIKAYDQKFAALQRYILKLKQTLALIEQAPQRFVAKQYVFVTAAKAHKVDSKTVRWQATHGSTSGQRQVYTNVECYDLYENRFILYILRRLRDYLSELLNSFIHDIDQKLAEVRQRQNEWKVYPEFAEAEGAIQRREFRGMQRRQLAKLCGRLEETRQLRSASYKEQSDDILKTIQQLRLLPFLTSVREDETFILSPTLVLLREPAYNALYEDYCKLQRLFQLDERQRIEAMLARCSVERTAKLYEYWVFLQVYTELKHMGFDETPKSCGIWNIFDDQPFRLRPNLLIRLVGIPAIYGESPPLEVSLRYEYRFGPNRNFCPDIYIEFIRGEQRRILILDAKYRNYTAPHCPSFQQDVEETAYHKYLLLRRRHPDGGGYSVAGVEQTRNQIAASFIIHSHDDDSFLDYGSGGQGNRYGAIPLVPSEKGMNITNLRRLLKMFMQMHLRIFDVCWADSHPYPVKANYIQALGGDHREDWEWEYSCAECENAWWVNHCGYCGRQKINVPKITFSDPSDNFFDADMGKPGEIHGKKLLKCSTCNHSYLSPRRSV